MAEPAIVEPTGRLEDIVTLIRRLRAPEGCPWDRKQTPPSLANYLIEAGEDSPTVNDSYMERKMSKTFLLRLSSA